MGTESLPAADHRSRVTDTEWHGDLGCWVVSARLDASWTLVGLFAAPERALAVARQAARRLAAPRRLEVTGLEARGGLAPSAGRGGRPP